MSDPVCCMVYLCNDDGDWAKVLVGHTPMHAFLCRRHSALLPSPMQEDLDRAFDEKFDPPLTRKRIVWRNG